MPSHAACLAWGCSGWVTGTAGPCLFRRPVNPTGLALFFEDSADGKGLSLQKHFRASKVHEGKEQSRVFQGKSQKRPLRSFRNSPSLALRGTDPSATANLAQPLQTLSGMSTAVWLQLSEQVKLFWKSKYFNDQRVRYLLRACGGPVVISLP